MKPGGGGARPLQIRRLTTVLALGAAASMTACGGASKDKGLDPVAGADESGPAIINMQRLPDAPDEASGVVLRGSGSSVRLALAGLEAGHRYEVWLYRSVVDAQALAAFRGPGRQVELRLPSVVGSLPLIDVSREDDADANHSGLSVLRVPLRDVIAGTARPTATPVGAGSAAPAPETPSQSVPGGG